MDLRYCQMGMRFITAEKKRSFIVVVSQNFLVRAGVQILSLIQAGYYVYCLRIKKTFDLTLIAGSLKNL